MKKIKYLLLVLVLGSAFTTALPPTSTLTISWKFLHVNDGYDLMNRCEVYDGDVLLATSTETKETVPNSIKVHLKKGKTYDLRIVAVSKTNGVWEEHTIENDYSVDALVPEEEFTPTKAKYKLKIVFDIDKGTSFKGFRKGTATSKDEDEE